IAGVEAGDEADGPVRVVHAVDEAAAERLGREREAHRVDDAALLDAARGHFPQLLHAGRVHLRVPSDREPERLLELLRQRAAWALAQHGRLRMADRAGLVVRLVLARAIHALVAGLHAD